MLHEVQVAEQVHVHRLEDRAEQLWSRLSPPHTYRPGHCSKWVYLEVYQFESTASDAHWGSCFGLCVLQGSQLTFPQFWTSGLEDAH